MAQFNYEQYAAQQAARKSASTSGDSKNANSRPEVRFFGEFMKNDGDVVVVRLPYKSMDDVIFEEFKIHQQQGIQKWWSCLLQMP